MKGGYVPFGAEARTARAWGQRGSRRATAGGLAAPCRLCAPTPAGRAPVGRRAVGAPWAPPGVGVPRPRGAGGGSPEDNRAAPLRAGLTAPGAASRLRPEGPRRGAPRSARTPGVFPSPGIHHLPAPNSASAARTRAGQRGWIHGTGGKLVASCRTRSPGPEPPAPVPRCPRAPSAARFRVLCPRPATYLLPQAALGSAGRSLGLSSGA